MHTSEIGLVSADSHVNEPRDLWSKNLPRSLREQAMQGIRAGDDGSWEIIFDGAPVTRAGATEEERLAVLDPEYRLKIMRQEGVAAECIFPTVGLYVWMLKDPLGCKVSCRIYNEWIIDQLQVHSPRFCCAGLIPTGRIEDALEEVEWVAERLGAVMLPAVASPDWNHPDWTPLWAAVAETGLPVVMHQGTGHNMIFYRGPGATIANVIATQSIAPRTATLMATSGILARHPDLHVVFVEFNTGWLAWAMQTADYYQDAFARYESTAETAISSSKSGRRALYPELPEPPSFYLARQVHSTFQADPVGLNNINLTGVSSLLWGSDFPHEEGTYPRTRQIVDDLSRPLDDATARKVFRDTAAQLFNFDAALLDRPI